MLNEISSEIKKLIHSFSDQDEVVFNNKKIRIDKLNFRPLELLGKEKIAFVDGGQAEIISAGNFCLSFIRVFAQVFKGDKKLDHCKKELYLLTNAKIVEDKLYYESRIFGDRLISEEDLLIDSNHETIRDGKERAPISKIACMARRFAELELSRQIEADHVVLDGTLQPTFKGEEIKLKDLPKKVCALAKTSNLFTVLGNSPSVLLDKISPFPVWRYLIEGNTCFVKMHPRSKYVFRFEGDADVLSPLADNSKDSLFLGYPYGLIYADKMARVSNEEKASLKSRLLLKAENKDIIRYLSSTNAHDILDSM